MKICNKDVNISEFVKIFLVADYSLSRTSESGETLERLRMKRK